MADELTYEEFETRARMLDLTDPEMLRELYPLVKDLMMMAGRINHLATELHGEIDPARLSKTASGE